MAQRRRRNLRRDGLVLLGSLIAHILVFYVAGRELFSPYHLPDENLPVQVELVPPEEIPPPPPIIPPKPIVQPKPKPPQPKPEPPQPQPVPKPQPTPQPTPPTPQKVVKQTLVKPTAPTKPTPIPTLTQATKQLTVSKLSSADIEAPPGPPKAVTRATVTAALPQRIAAPNLNLHKNKQASSQMAPPVTIPGGAFSPPPSAGGQASGGGTGTPGGPTTGPLPGSRLPPGFGEGLNGGLLGCVNAAVVHLTPEQQERCRGRYGADIGHAPGMSAVGATKRGQFDTENAADKADQQYRDSTPSAGTTPSSENPHVGPLIEKALGGGQ